MLTKTSLNRHPTNEVEQDIYDSERNLQNLHLPIIPKKRSSTNKYLQNQLLKFSCRLQVNKVKLNVWFRWLQEILV